MVVVIPDFLAIERSGMKLGYEGTTVYNEIGAFRCRERQQGLCLSEFAHVHIREDLISLHKPARKTYETRIRLITILFF